MIKFNSMNEWRFSGEIFYLKELEKDYGASVKIRGVSEGSFAQRECELSCLVGVDAYKDAVKKGIKQYKHVALSGHMETFVKNGIPKMMFIADYILEVA